MSHDPGLGISVVLPVYAGADPVHLRRALESVFNQTHPADEVLVVEDGPLTTGHEDVLAALERVQPSLRRVRLERNSGVAVATQTGVEAARFPWIARMDADDIALPERFARQLDAVRAGDVDVVGTAMVEFADDEDVDVGVRVMPAGHDAIVRRMRRTNPLNHPTVLFRRSLALSVGGYQRLDHLEDYDLWARMWAAGGRLKNLPEPLLRYRADDAMFARRRQAGIHRAEVRLQRNLHRYGLVSAPRMALNIISRTGFRLLPESLMRRAYRVLFHQRGPVSLGFASVTEHKPTSTRLQAPGWYRAALRAEERVLRATIGKRLRARDANLELGGVTNRVRHPTLGHVASERLLPGTDAPAVELEHHLARYTWAFRACEGLDVLDVGCGVGYGTSLLAWVAHTATGIDRDAEAIATATRTYRGDNLSYVHDTAESELPKADVVTCFEVIEHVDDPAAVCKALMTAAPRVLISYPNPFAAGPHLNPHHVVDWPLRVMRAALREAGATAMRGHHQNLTSPAVRRGTPPWAAIWLLDVTR